MKSPAMLEHLPWRIAGLLALGVLVVVYQPEDGGALQRIAIPVLMAVAAWLLVQNVAAVGIGAAALAVIHSSPGSEDWISALAYPLLAAISAAIVLAVLVQRFRRRIADTHEARWRHRRTRATAGQPADRPGDPE